jgi:hypothetical protein
LIRRLRREINKGIMGEWNIGMMGKKIKCLNPLFQYSGDSLPAIRTISKARRDRLAALGAGLGGTELDGAHLGMSGFIEDPAAAGAFQEGLSPLNRDQRDEKKAYIVVQALEAGRG